MYADPLGRLALLWAVVFVLILCTFTAGCSVHGYKIETLQEPKTIIVEHPSTVKVPSNNDGRAVGGS